MSKIEKPLEDTKKWLLVMALTVVGMGANFWGFPVYILDEAKNAACAMEMLQRGDWITPTVNGQLRTDKPPLHYFFMMASYKVFGVSPAAARLFSVVMGWLTVLVVYHFTRKLAGATVAFYAGLALACSLFVMMGSIWLFRIRISFSSSPLVGCRFVMRGSPASGATYGA